MIAIAHEKEVRVRVNQRIRVPSVRVIGPDGSQLGVMSSKEALTIAQGHELDLVEVSPNSSPPVCRIMDFGKFKYEQSKRAKKAKKKQHIMHLKEVKFRPKIEEHDYRFKLNHARRFLQANDKVKFTLTFRGREMSHAELGHKLLERVVADLDDVGQVEGRVRSEGRNLVLVMIPKNVKARS
ncbi:MAG: translation initiation factor IF-3 [Candidatus Eiseniibacteriota bacterium]|nr:MAG: translation initiation factor IF-3 [Candidatus Eisenbacteria bacterium]